VSDTWSLAKIVRKVEFKLLQASTLPLLLHSAVRFRRLVAPAFRWRQPVASCLMESPS